MKASIPATLLLCCLIAGQQNAMVWEPPATDPFVLTMAPGNKVFLPRALRAGDKVITPQGIEPWEIHYINPSTPEPGIPDRDVIYQIEIPQSSRSASKPQAREFTYEEVMGKASQSRQENTKTYSNFFDQFAAKEKQKEEGKVDQIKSLRKDLNAAVDDLKAKWFPKRTKIENYDIIAKTVKAISSITEWDVDEMSSWGLNEYDISAIYKASSELNQGNVIKTVLEGEMKSLERQNSRLSDEIVEAKNASREAFYESQRAANASRDAAYESRRAASSADDATDAAKQAEQKARDAESAASTMRRWW